MAGAGAADGADAWSDKDERLAAEIDGIHVESPAFGVRKISKMLQKQGERRATRYRVAKLMGIRPCCPLPSLSKPSRESRRFSYLLKGKSILFPNQVWSTDITYVQIGGRHMYLTAVIDWFSRYIVS